MPWRLDSLTRTDDIVAAVHQLVATGGLQAVTYRQVARRLRLSASTLHGHYPDQKHLLNFVTHQLSLARYAESSEAVRARGLVALLPATPEERRDSVVWLCLRDHARIEPRLSVTMEEAIAAERHVIQTALELAGVPLEQAQAATVPLHALVEGLESALTIAERPMQIEQAQDVLEQVTRALTGRTGLTTTSTLTTTGL